LQALLPEARFIDLGPVSDLWRVLKSPAEIEILRAAAGIADATMQVLADSVRVGMRVRDVAAIAAAEFLRRGADHGGPGPIIRARGDAEFLHAQAADEMLGHGDVLHVELTPAVAGYSARLMRPLLLGGNPDAERVAARLVALQDRQIAAMHPGMPASEVDALVREPILREGLRRRFANVTGYTLGLYARTPRPSDFSRCFRPGAEWRLEAGMMFHMYVSAGSVAISETVLVTETGPARLTRFPRAPVILPASA
jgi:Xaa-Pro dipeptidase